MFSIELTNLLDGLLNCLICNLTGRFDWTYSSSDRTLLLSRSFWVLQRIIDFICTNRMTEVVLYDKERCKLKVWSCLSHFVSHSRVLRSLSYTCWIDWWPFDVECAVDWLSRSSIKALSILFEICLWFNEVTLWFVWTTCNRILLFHGKLKVLLRACCRSSSLRSKRCLNVSVRYNNLAPMSSVWLFVIDLSMNNIDWSAICFCTTRHTNNIVDVHVAISIDLLE